MACTNCDDTCTWSCGWNGCVGYCTSTCSGTCTGSCSGCSGTCTGGCTGCSTTCTGGCYGCQGTCTSSCTGACKSGCTGCSGTCKGDCDGCSGCGGACSSSCTGCSGSCSGACDNACTATGMADAINSLAAHFGIGNLILSNDFYNLNNILGRDLSRRSISAYADVSADIAAGKQVKTGTFNAIYENVKRDGYATNENMGMISAAQLLRLAAYIKTCAQQDLRS